LENKLKGKKILLIAPKTFGYEVEIQKKLISLGASVKYFDDRPFTSKIKKIKLRLAPIILTKEINSYFNKIITTTKDTSFDFIFCIKQECFPRHLLEELFKLHPNSKKIFYTWDSFVNNKNALENLDLFDRCLTFDSDDSKKFGLQHRPLFYVDVFANLSEHSIEYDLSVVGSVHYKRYLFLKNIKQSLSNKYKIYFYQFVPSKSLFYARKVLLFPFYGFSKKDEFNYKTLDRSSVRKIFAKSKVIIDYAHHNQTGLTMRCIEALGAKKKLITNNVDIVNYDFYDNRNILLLRNNSIKIPDDFLITPYRDIEIQIFNRYSLEGWLDEVLYN
jgi:hypothetical protein